MLQKLALIITLSLFSTPAFAYCTYVDDVDMKIEIDEVENSANLDVRNAYADNTCIITKSWHPGGYRCDDTNPDTNHVTVIANDTAHHVFNYRDPNNTNYYCTTP